MHHLKELEKLPKELFNEAQNDGIFSSKNFLKHSNIDLN